MKRLTLVALVLVTIVGTWVVTKQVDRRDRQRLERFAGEAETRAVRAEKRAEGYKRMIDDSRGAPAGESRGAAAIPGAAAAMALAPFPFEPQIADLSKQLGLDAAQTDELRGLYQKQWELAKRLAAAGAAPAGVAATPLSVEAARFLSPEQVRRLQDIEAQHQAVEAPRTAAAHAQTLAQTLGLDEGQTRRVADALAALYQGTVPAAGGDGAADHIKQTLRPILNDAQWKTLVASLGDHDPGVAPTLAAP